MPTKNDTTKVDFYTSTAEVTAAINAAIAKSGETKIMEHESYVIELEKCPHCSSLPTLLFKLPVYGWGGCEIKCPACGAEMRNAKFSESIFVEETKTLKTPVTIESIAACIKSTVERWNRRADT